MKTRIPALFNIIKVFLILTPDRIRVILSEHLHWRKPLWTIVVALSTFWKMIPYRCQSVVPMWYVLLSLLHEAEQK